MQQRQVFVLVACLLFCASALAYREQGRSDTASIKLTDVQALTFKAGQYTNARRTSAIPQLECTGGSALSRRDLHPTVVQCVNRGTDGYDVQWACSAELDSRVKLGDIDVSCEGYRDPDDPYVLKGSCGLRYTLEYTAQGKEEASSQSSWSNYNRYGTTGQSEGSSWFGRFFTYFVIIVVLIGLYSTCKSRPSIGSSFASAGPSPSAPPMGGFPGYPNMNGMGYNAGVSGMGVPPVYSAPSSSFGGGGFWSGMFTGGLLANLFAPRATSYYNPAPGRSWGSSSSSSSPSSSRSTTRTSTSYGGTSRR
eukprot:TRINITY_DN4160_c0_g1_i1.p1 TRINITY_DN4160_c0_g1~~TRINITY_DN4160_c0_g1_i1.p1  ORF type:complete len:307 (+),score=41.92 TRINITY_DN4160_c0_g1_i1:107-1027(+)